jgi:hypothetical protein
MLTQRMHIISVVAVICCGTLGCSSKNPVRSSNSPESVIVSKNHTVAGSPTATNQDTKNIIVCKTQRKVGSHIPVRVCRTRGEMEAAQKAAMEMAGPLRTMGGTGNR